jgi:hypothetical protein
VVLPVILSLGIIVGTSHGWITITLPSGWAVITMFSRVIEGINKSQVFIHISTNVGVIDGNVSQNGVTIDQESSSEGETGFINVNTVVLGYASGQIGKKVDIQLSSESSFASK